MHRKDGFYTAVATPIRPDGTLAEAGYRREIRQQIDAGASGILVMGTMGLLGCVPNGEYERIIRVACEAAAGRVRLLVGASDNSLARVRDRVAVINRYPADAVVLTAPYYEKLANATLISFFQKCAAMTEKDVYLYDLPGLTKHKITYAMVRELAETPNIRGIKSGDLELIKALHDSQRDGTPDALKADFLPIFSGADLFGVANVYGIKNYLDGIFSCFPASMRKIQDALDAGDFGTAKIWLARIMKVRDAMLAGSLWPMFSYAMNLIGCEGYFGPDYEAEATPAQKELVARLMRELGEVS